MNKLSLSSLPTTTAKPALMNILTSFFIPAALSKPTKEAHKHHRLGLEEHKIISTLPFRSCFVTTTLDNVVPCQVANKRTGKKHNACAVFLQFNFGPQKAGSDKRIKAMKIEANVVEPSRDENAETEVCGAIYFPNCTVCRAAVADLPTGVGHVNKEDVVCYKRCWKPVADHDLEPQKPSSSSSASSATTESELEIKARYPVSAQSKVELVEINTHKGISASPEFQGVTVGNASTDISKKYNIPNAQVMEAFPVGATGAVWQIYENDLYKSGVPASVNVAMVVQTDGAPFEIQLKFSGRCPMLGMLSLKAKLEMRVERGLLDVKAPEVWDTDCGLDDVESAAFLEWVKKETPNHWAETVDFDN